MGWILFACWLAAAGVTGASGNDRNKIAKEASSLSEVQVVAHPSNPIDVLPRSRLSALFLGKVSEWPDGTPVAIYDLAVSDPVREGLSWAIHGRSAETVEGSWRRAQLRGGATARRVVTESEALQAVAGDPGGLGYVAASTPTPGLKVVAVATEPELIETVEPRYTAMAKRARARGVVVLRIRIDERGAVSGVRPLRELPHGLTEEAVRAVRRWRYLPAELDGKPVAVDIDVPVRFRYPF